MGGKTNGQPCGAASSRASMSLLATERAGGALGRAAAQKIANYNKVRSWFISLCQQGGAGIDLELGEIEAPFLIDANGRQVPVSADSDLLQDPQSLDPHQPIILSEEHVAACRGYLMSQVTDQLLQGKTSEALQLIVKHTTMDEDSALGFISEASEAINENLDQELSSETIINEMIRNYKNGNGYQDRFGNSIDPEAWFIRKYGVEDGTKYEQIERAADLKGIDIDIEEALEEQKSMQCGDYSHCQQVGCDGDCTNYLLADAKEEEYGRALRQLGGMNRVREILFEDAEDRAYADYGGATDHIALEAYVDANEEELIKQRLAAIQKAGGDPLYLTVGVKECFEGDEGDLKIASLSPYRLPTEYNNNLEINGATLSPGRAWGRTYLTSQGLVRESREYRSPEFPEMEVLVSRDHSEDGVVSEGLARAGRLTAKVRLAASRNEGPDGRQLRAIVKTSRPGDYSLRVEEQEVKIDSKEAAELSKSPEKLDSWVAERALKEYQLAEELHIKEVMKHEENYRQRRQAKADEEKRQAAAEEARRQDPELQAERLLS